MLKIALYHTLKLGGIGKLQYLCTVIQERWESQVLKLLPLQGDRVAPIITQGDALG